MTCNVVEGLVAMLISGMLNYVICVLIFNSAIPAALIPVGMVLATIGIWRYAFPAIEDTLNSIFN